MCIRDSYYTGECGMSKEALEWPALIFAYLRLEQAILGLIREDDDDDLPIFSFIRLCIITCPNKHEFVKWN